MRRILLFTAIVMVSLAGFVSGIAPSALASTSAFRSGHAGAVVVAETSNIYNNQSGRCLGIAGGHSAGIFNCNGGPNQTWHTGRCNPHSFHCYYAQIINSRGQCLGVAGGSTRAGARIVSWPCLGISHRDQYWWYYCELTVNTQACVFINLGTPANAIGAGGKVLGVSGGSKANGANVVLWANTFPDRGQHPDQIWTYASGGT